MSADEPIMEEMKDWKVVPEDHNSDFPVLVPVGKPYWNSDTTTPFAAIVALKPGESLAGVTRGCIYVFMDGGDFVFSDNLHAIDANYPVIVSKIPCPELTKMLRREFRECSIFYRPNSLGIRPHRLIEMWNARTAELKIDIRRLGYSFALITLIAWPDMEKKHMTWQQRLDSALEQDISLTKTDKTPNESNHVTLFRQFCENLGLKKGVQRKFGRAINNLHLCLKKAHAKC